MSDSSPSKSTAQLRAEARERRLLLSDQRLARIKAMSQGKELPELDNNIPLPSTQSSTTTATTTNNEHEPALQSAINTTPTDAPATQTTGVVVSKTTASSTPKSSKRRTSHTKEKKKAHKTEKLGFSPQERMVAAQMQERAYLTSTRRWRIIHIVVTTVVCVAAFVYVVWTTAVIHVNGEEVLGALLFTPHGDLRIPAVGVFNYFVATECVLTAARYLLDKPSTNPPMSDLLHQIQMVAPAQMSSAGGAMAGVVQTVTNAGFIFQLLVSDFCYFILVFGIGIIACAYITGLDEIQSVFLV